METIRKFSDPSHLYLHLSAACLLGLVLGLACIFVSALWVLAGLLALIFVFAVFKRPEIGLLSIVMVTSGLIDDERLPLLSFASISFHVTDLILLFLFALVLIRSLSVPGYPFSKTPLDFPLLWFYMALLASALLASLSPSVDRSWIFRQLRPLTYYLGFFCVTGLILKKKALLFCVNGLFWIAILASLAMMLQVVLPSFQLVDTKSIELYASGEENFGVIRSYLPADRLIFIMLLISIASLVLKVELLPRKLELIRAGIMAGGLLLTFQRNYFLTFLLMIALLGLLIRWSGKFHLVGLAILALGVVSLAVVLHLDPVDKYITAASDRLFREMQPQFLEQDGSTQWRVIETGYAIQSILEHPWLGIGLGNFYRPTLVRDVELGGVGGIRWYNHNAYLWVLIDMGLLGFIPFVLFYAAAIVRGLKYWQRVPDQRLSVVLLGGTLGIFGQAIGNIVAPNFFQSWMVFVFAAVIGINELIIKWEVHALQNSE